MTPVLLAQSLMLLAHADGIGRDHAVVFAAGDDEIAEAHRMVIADEIDGYVAVWEMDGKLEILTRARTTDLDRKLGDVVDALTARLARMRIAKPGQWTTWRGKGAA